MNVQDVVTQILAALQDELGAGFTQVRTFAQAQSERLARLAITIGEERMHGVLKTNNQMFERFLRRLEEETRAFARQLAVLTILTLEKAWNAVVGVVWGALNALIAQTGLPVALPQPPGE